MQNRRSFLKATGTLASGLLIGRSAFSMDDFAPTGSIKKFGLQLYSLRNDLPNDPKGVFKNRWRLSVINKLKAMKASRACFGA